MKGPAIVVGSAGQDGTILREALAARGVDCIGINRGVIESGTLGVTEAFDLFDADAVHALLRSRPPSEIYYLAAEHGSAEDRIRFSASSIDRARGVHETGLLNFLEALRLTGCDASLVYASSSLVFASSPEKALDESSAFSPSSVYAITKAAGSAYCRLYRREFGVRSSVAFLFNHESPLRGSSYVSQKIIRGARAIVDGQAVPLLLRDLGARIDWGYAPDYVDAMQRIAALEVADDFIVATGQTHSVGEFVEAVFHEARLDWRHWVVEESAALADAGAVRFGDSSKLQRETGWRPSVSFQEMVRLLWNASRARVVADE